MLNVLMKTFSRSCPFLMALVLLNAVAYAAELSPLGLWKTIDDATGELRGFVRIKEVNGQYEGKIERIFPKPGDDPNPKCDQCSGALHDQPILGMTILWNLTKQGEDYQGGQILDPESGKLYRARMKVIDNGQKLDVRGFIGFSLLGRSQIWLRAE